MQVKDEGKQQLLAMQIGKGESSAIALAMEFPGSTVILDDFKARKIAERPGIIITGTIGVIIKAKIKGIVPAIKPILSEIKQNGFHISEELKQLSLKEAGE